MKKIVLAALCGMLLLSGAGCDLAGSRQNQEIITVNGRGTSTSLPDKAVIELGVSTQAKTIMDATAKHAEITARVFSALSPKIENPKTDLKTVRFYVYPIYNYAKKGLPLIIGYRAESALQVTLFDPTKVEEIITAGLTAGANQVNLVNYGLKNEKLLYKEAIQNAKDDARLKAESIAKEYKVKLLKPLSIKELNISVVNNRPYAFGVGGPGTGDQSLAPGEIKVESLIEVNYATR